LTTAVQLPPPLALTVISAGHCAIGGWVSLTVTVKLQESLLPEASVATHLTLVVPTAKEEPEGGVQTRPTPGQLSEALAV
jgi:hypothetical protein